MEFLMGLGTYCSSSLARSRHDWLMAYLTAMPLRERWGSIDALEVQRVAGECVQTCL